MRPSFELTHRKDVKLENIFSLNDNFWFCFPSLFCVSFVGGRIII